MYDIFLLSYGEPLADKHWSNLKEKYPNAKRVDGIDGIMNAHRHCSLMSMTSHFFVIDADNEILDFDFKFKLEEWDKPYVHVWRAINPINGLVYGWGGIKLFPKKLFKNQDMPLDMTTSFPLKIMDEVASITHFNSSPFDTWRSAFRECVKLSCKDDQESRERLNIWCSVAHGNFFEHSLRGSCEGLEYGLKHRDDVSMLMKINDWFWLKERFENCLK